MQFKKKLCSAFISKVYYQYNNYRPFRLLQETQEQAINYTRIDISHIWYLSEILYPLLTLNADPLEIDGLLSSFSLL